MVNVSKLNKIINIMDAIDEKKKMDLIKKVRMNHKSTNKVGDNK